MTDHHAPPIGATTLGYPRIGRHRELKRALESYWAGTIPGRDLISTGAQMRADAVRACAKAGVDSVPVNTFSFYDQMLDACVMLGAIPPRFDDVGGTDSLFGFDAYRYFAMARGTTRVAPLEMTKWFDTNYHYLVPEIGSQTSFVPDPTKPLTEYAEALAAGVNPRPVLIGPYTFLALSKPPVEEPGFRPLDRLADLTGAYLLLLDALSEAGASWVQLDEPALVRDLSTHDVQQVEQCYARLAAAQKRPALFVSTYFASPVEAFPALVRAGVDAVGLDLTSGVDPTLTAGCDLTSTTLVLGVVDGRNVWKIDANCAIAQLEAWCDQAANLAISTSCSLLHVPYDVSEETELPASLRAKLAFADQKLDEVVLLWQMLGAKADGCDEENRASTRGSLGADRPASRPQVAAVPEITERERQRGTRAARRKAQAERLKLPILPTTTIGSFPQTAQVRLARADYRRGRIDERSYIEAMESEIARVIDLQEHLGLDVLVHGEPERNDMVQYFAEQLDGFANTSNGWVQSYGSRCVRPPILFGDVARPHPMTVRWTAYAKSLTHKPVKGMLTGPVTMLAWSFVRQDQPLPVTADNVALVLREEVIDLEQHGIPIIQVDEPALRESLPLRVADQADYLRWSVDAFRLATAGASDDVQVHTHLCYSEFGDIVEAIHRLDADVTSIEAARSGMELLGAVREAGFEGDFGPGVYDIHSPRVPDTSEMVALLRRAVQVLPSGQLWANPDCGLKTRAYSEAVRSLAHLVEAAAIVRGELTHQTR